MIRHEQEPTSIEAALQRKFQAVSDDEQLRQIARSRQEARDRAAFSLVTSVTLPDVLPHEYLIYLLSLNEERYKAMAPDNHKSFQIVHAEEEKIEGTVYEFSEHVGRLPIHEKMRILQVNSTTDGIGYIAQRSVGKRIPPSSLVPVELHHTLEPVTEGTKLTWELHVGRNLAGIGKLVKWVGEHVMLPPEQQGIQTTHAGQEFLQGGRNMLMGK